MDFHQELTSIVFCCSDYLLWQMRTLVGLGVQRPTCGEQHMNTTGGWKLTQAGYCKVSGLRIIFEVFTNWIQNWFKKWDFTWSLGWRSCRGRARRGKASAEEPFSGCRGALSTWIGQFGILDFQTPELELLSFDDWPFSDSNKIWRKQLQRWWSMLLVFRPMPMLQTVSLRSVP